MNWPRWNIRDLPAFISAVQGLINTGDAGRLPNIILYTIIILVYLMLIGPEFIFI